MAVTKPAQSPELKGQGDIHYLRVYIRHGAGALEEIKAVDSDANGESGDFGRVEISRMLFELSDGAFADYQH